MQTNALRTSSLLAVLALAGCSGGRALNPFTDEGGAGGGGRGSVSVEVQNLNFNDATLYAVRNSQRTRIGRVTGKTDGRFQLQWDFSVPLQVLVDFVAGQGCRTAPLLVDPGDRLRVQIPSTVGGTSCLLTKR